MASADFPCPCEVTGSPQVRTRCFAAQPPHLPPRLNRWTSLCGASSSASCRPSMGFLFIGSPFSPSLPPPARLPSQSWLQMVIVHVSMFGFLTGDFHPICNAPILGAHQARWSELPPRCAFRFFMTKTFSTEAILAPGGSRSACSR